VAVVGRDIEPVGAGADRVGVEKASNRPGGGQLGGDIGGDARQREHPDMDHLPGVADFLQVATV
jgi:hypothetical protein